MISNGIFLLYHPGGVDNEPGCEVGASHSAKQGHPETQTCAKQTRILQGGE